MVISSNSSVQLAYVDAASSPPCPHPTLRILSVRLLNPIWTILSLIILLSDFHLFLQPDFSAHAYTQRLLDQLASRQDTGLYTSAPSSAANREDSAMSQALSKLSLMMDQISTSIRQEVTVHYDLLIDHAKQTTATEHELTSLVELIVSLQTSVREMESSVQQDYTLLKTLDQRISKLQLAADTLRRAVSFLLLCRRLEIQLAAAFPDNKSEAPLAALPSAALTLQSIGTCVSLQLPFAGQRP